MKLRPLLSARLDNRFNELNFPIIASPKLDGIRCLIVNGKPMSRSLKPIRNYFIQRTLSGLPSLDGELMIGDPTNPLVFNGTTSGVMSYDGEPDFYYHVFDMFEPADMPFYQRYIRVGEAAKKHPRIKVVPNIRVADLKALKEYEEKCVAQGYEGIMLRDPRGHYKYGRSTFNEGTLIKVKRLLEAEGIVIGFKELMHNENIAKVSELGYTTRSSEQENLVPGNTLGALVLRVPGLVQTLKVGTGFDAMLRQQIWVNQKKYLGKIVTFKYFPTVKTAPRQPVFKCFREDLEKDDLQDINLGA